MAALLSTQSGAFSFFGIHASLGILTLEGHPPSHRLPTESVGRRRGGGCPSRVKMPRIVYGSRVSTVVRNVCSLLKLWLNKEGRRLKPISSVEKLSLGRTAC